MGEIGDYSSCHFIVESVVKMERLPGLVVSFKSIPGSSVTEVKDLTVQTRS